MSLDWKNDYDKSLRLKDAAIARMLREIPDDGCVSQFSTVQISQFLFQELQHNIKNGISNLYEDRKSIGTVPEAPKDPNNKMAYAKYKKEIKDREKEQNVRIFTFEMYTIFNKISKHIFSLSKDPSSIPEYTEEELAKANATIQNWRR